MRPRASRWQIAGAKLVSVIGQAIARKMSGDIARFLVVALSAACVVEFALERIF
jgi:hypothetical protein